MTRYRAISLQIKGKPFFVFGGEHDADFIEAMTNPAPKSEKEFFGRLRHHLEWPE